jgi:hypothetical protein
MIAQVTPVAFAAISWRFYLVFAVCGLSNAVFFWAFLPETRGLLLEEVDDYFARVPLFVPTSRVRIGKREDEMWEHGVAAVDGEDGQPWEKVKAEHKAGVYSITDADKWTISLIAKKSSTMICTWDALTTFTGQLVDNGMHSVKSGLQKIAPCSSGGTDTCIAIPC